MTDSGSDLASQFGKTTIRFIVTIVGLLLLRALVDSLPMLKGVSFIEGSLISGIVLANAVVDAAILVTTLVFGLALSRDFGKFFPGAPDLGRITLLLTVLLVFVLAYNVCELPFACMFTSPENLTSFGTAGSESNLGQAAGQFSSLLQQLAGTVLSEGVKRSHAAVLETYQRLAVARMRQSPDLYGWVFLSISAIPLLGIVVIGSRNLEAISELLFRQAGAVTARLQANPVRATRELSSDDMNRLIQLKTLLDQGTITQAEFVEQKKLILEHPGVPEESAELRRLKQLLDVGGLTQEEYELQKRHFRN